MEVTAQEHLRGWQWIHSLPAWGEELGIKFASDFKGTRSEDTNSINKALNFRHILKKRMHNWLENIRPVSETQWKAEILIQAKWNTDGPKFLGIGIKSKGKKSHGEIYLWNKRKTRSFLHNCRDTWQKITLYFEEFVEASKITDPANSTILFRDEKGREIPFTSVYLL